MYQPDDADDVVRRVREGFSATQRPPDAFLVGSSEGCEPEEEVGPFRGRDWQSLEPDFLDLHYSALSFFSEGALRYFLPAFLVADLRGLLKTADPVFTLTHGFAEWTSTVRVGGKDWRRRYGPLILLNPRRYGAMTLGDCARYRLSVFAREEAVAIVAYLRHVTARDDRGLSDGAVDAALRLFWLSRAQHAPTVSGSTHTCAKKMRSMLR
jgi:hypothetical protein